MVPRLVVGLLGNERIDPVGPGVWGETRLVVPGIEPGSRYRDIFTAESIDAVTDGEHTSLSLTAVFATLPFALLERVDR